MKLVSSACIVAWLPQLDLAYKQPGISAIQTQEAKNGADNNEPKLFTGFPNTTTTTTIPNCDSWKCKEFYTPKRDHHTILLNISNPDMAYQGVRKGDEVCCDPTCAIWKCGKGFTNNSAYSGNTGWTDEQCCDLSCGREGGVECPAGWVITPEMKNKAGLTADDCCTATCASVKCVEPVAPYPKGHKQLDVLSTEIGVCCQETCAAMVCPVFTTHDPAKLKVISKDKNVCCVPTCQQHVIDGKCKNGYESNTANLMEVAGDGKHCCKLKCGDSDGRFGYKCGSGWVPHGDSRSCATQPCTDPQCCIKTCGIFECPPEGYVKHTDKDHWWPADTETCCQKTCKLHECDATKGWVPGTNFKRNDTISEDSKVCCDPFCSRHTCGSNDTALIPDADAIPGADDKTCCEPKLCQVYRNMTQSSSNGCNSHDHEAVPPELCNAMYTGIPNNRTNETEYIRCYYDDIFGLCRLSSTEIAENKMPKGCAGM
eukprot:gb/GFBE01018272.1/.p1 GENE.gb/GFBE01018272.1/~~gb/GFBE01018272.1/.p1  ORF type:complete len:484 (+),score=121.24 gb/GFBE01018272.1/:1-1452(+)